MIPLKQPKVNSNLQTFKFRSELYNLNKINIVKKEIKRYEEECNYGYIECPCCGSDKLIGHGSYERNVIIYNECKRIKIKRVLCKECGKTHALIPYFLTPYYQHEKTFIYRVCEEKILKETGVITDRSDGKSIDSKIEMLSQIIRGWINYYKIADMKNTMKEVSKHIRHRLRMCIWKYWKIPRTRYKALSKLGIKEENAYMVANTRRGYYFASSIVVLHMAISNNRLKQKGLVFPLEYYSKVHINTN